jgi:hypothetical protein
VDAKVPIQRHLIVKYIADNIQDISFELSKHFGLVPSIQTDDMFNRGEATYEVVKISSLGGVLWVANRVDELETPRYFKSYETMMSWKGGIDE